MKVEIIGPLHLFWFLLPSGCGIAITYLNQLCMQMIKDLYLSLQNTIPHWNLEKYRQSHKNRGVPINKMKEVANCSLNDSSILTLAATKVCKMLFPWRVKNHTADTVGTFNRLVDFNTMTSSSPSEATFPIDNMDYNWSSFRCMYTSMINIPYELIINSIRSETQV